MAEAPQRAAPQQPPPRGNNNEPRFRRGAEWVAMIDLVVNGMSLVILIGVCIAFAVALSGSNVKNDKQVKKMLKENRMTMKTLTAIIVVVLILSILTTAVTFYVATWLLTATDPTTPTQEALDKATRWFWINVGLLMLNAVSTRTSPAPLDAQEDKELGFSIMDAMLGDGATHALIIFRCVGLTIVYFYKNELESVPEHQRGFRLGSRLVSDPYLGDERRGYLNGGKHERESRRTMQTFYQRSHDGHGQQQS